MIDTTIDQNNRQFNRDTIDRHSQMVGRGSYLNEGRREVIDNLARESRDRVNAETAAKLRSGAFQAALDQGNLERGRLQSGAGTGVQLAGAQQQLGYGDVAALRDVGAQQQNLVQQDLTLNYEDFLRQFYYPQEQLNYMMSLTQGAPYSSSQSSIGTQQVPTANTFAQSLGGIGALAGGLGQIGAGGGLGAIFG